MGADLSQFIKNFRFFLSHKLTGVVLRVIFSFIVNSLYLSWQMEMKLLVGNQFLF